MRTDNLYMHTFSIRGSICAPCCPHSFTELSHQNRRTVHCISSTCWFLESPKRIQNVFEMSVPSQYISILFLSILFQLHKTSHVASASCQNAYIADQHGQYKCPCVQGTFSFGSIHICFRALENPSLKSTNLHLLLLVTI